MFDYEDKNWNIFQRRGKLSPLDLGSAGLQPDIPFCVRIQRVSKLTVSNLTTVYISDFFFKFNR